MKHQVPAELYMPLLVSVIISDTFPDRTHSKPRKESRYYWDYIFHNLSEALHYIRQCMVLPLKGIPLHRMTKQKGPDGALEYELPVF